MKNILLNVILKMIMGKFADFVKDTVAILNNADLTGEEKRDEAFGKIKENAKISGQELRSSIINLAIEIAVNLLKGK